jgi:hypothetical protein
VRYVLVAAGRGAWRNHVSVVYQGRAGTLCPYGAVSIAPVCTPGCAARHALLAEVIMYPALSIQQPAGRAGVACGDWGRDPGGVVAPGLLEPGITWYDVLGVLPGAGARNLRRKYEEKAGLLRPEMIAGAPPNVVTAVRRAQELLDTAWQVLGDPQRRTHYDEAIGLRRSGGGLGQPGTGTGWLGPRRRRNRPGAVPDVRGLFYHVGLEVATRRGLRVRTVRLTGRPMAVDGLVVDQDPRPPARAHRGGTLTVQLWHPPARPAAPAGSGRSSPEAASLTLNRQQPGCRLSECA